MYNSITLIGRLVRDPEMRYTPSGIPVATFALAVGRPFSNAQGQKETDFFDVVCWRKLAELVANNLAKGRLVCVAGSLQTRTYETPEGQKRKVYEINASQVKFLDRKPDGDAPASAGSDMGREVEDDGIPFSDGACAA